MRLAVARPAAGGGRWVEVAPVRLQRWLDGFTERHGPPDAVVVDRTVQLVAPDGAVAVVHAAVGAPAPSDLADLVAQAAVPRRLGLLLARQAAVAVGIADGDRLIQSRVDSSYVQSRTAAGGWSQQRFARRRANQAKAAAAAAADLAAAVLAPQAPGLAALVTGGDRGTVATILADPRLAVLSALRSIRFLDVGEPRLVVLESAVARARAVRIKVIDPAVDST